MATDFYRLRVQGLHQTEYNECVMHFKGVNLTAADYLENARDLINSWVDSILTPWLELMPASYQLLRLSAMKASAGGGGELSNEFQFGDQVGFVAGGAASQQLCPVILLIPPMGIKTAGKVFLPAIAESQIASNVVNSTWLSNVDNLMTLTMAGFAISGITWTQSVYSRKNNAFSDVVDYSVSSIVGFQRRRQRAPL